MTELCNHRRFKQNIDKQYVGKDFSKALSSDKLTPEKVRRQLQLQLQLHGQWQRQRRQAEDLFYLVWKISS